MLCGNPIKKPIHLQGLHWNIKRLQFGIQGCTLSCADVDLVKAALAAVEYDLTAAQAVLAEMQGMRTVRCRCATVHTLTLRPVSCTLAYLVAPLCREMAWFELQTASRAYPSRMAQARMPQR